MATALSGMVSRMVAQAFWRRGFHEPALVSQWPSVVGQALARETAPVRIAFPRGERTGGTLHVRVEGAFALELQHLAPLVIERVNAYYGYAAVGGLALHQAPVRRRPAPPSTGRSAEPAGPEIGSGPRVAIDGIEDEGLKAALRELGEARARRLRPPARSDRPRAPG